MLIFTITNFIYSLEKILYNLLFSWIFYNSVNSKTKKKSVASGDLETETQIAKLKVEKTLSGDATTCQHNLTFLFDHHPPKMHVQVIDPTEIDKAFDEVLIFDLGN